MNMHLSVHVLPHPSSKDGPLAVEDLSISESDLTQYLGIISKSLEVYLDREAIRHGLWKEYKAEDQMTQIRIKVDRVMRTLERIRMREEQALVDNAREEIYDIINYAVFAWQQLTD